MVNVSSRHTNAYMARLTPQQNIHGYLQSRTVFFLMNIHNRFRTIYFARVSLVFTSIIELHLTALTVRAIPH